MKGGRWRFAAGHSLLLLAALTVVCFNANPCANRLCDAAATGDLKALHHLLALGADPNLAGEGGMTALDWANSPSAQKLLIDYGARRRGK